MRADVDAWIGLTLLDADGRRLGVIEETYSNKQTGEPLWMVVRTGRIRAQRRFVPLAGATDDGDAIRTPRTKREIDTAPDVDPAQQLSDREVRDLYRHYEMALDPPLETETEIQPETESESEPPPSAEERIADRIRRYTA
jgi:hypothetical protein